MRKHVLVLTTTVAILACGAIAASAQSLAAQAPGTQQSPSTQAIPGGSMQQQDQTRLQRRAQIDEDSDQSGSYPGGMMGGRMMNRGMMGPGAIGGGMMGRGMMGQGYDRGIMGPMVMMRMIFSLMDADGDGKLTLQEFQAAHERIFKAMDTDHDGTVTFEEMRAFMRGR